MEMDIEPSSSTATREPVFVEIKPHFNRDEQKTGPVVTKHRKKAENEDLQQSDLDPNCIINIEKRLVRIEYPGEVKNIDRAIETLGGIDSIEASVAEHSRKLELHFHPRSKYNKLCFADKDFRPGILIKVKKQPSYLEPSIFDNSNSDRLKCDYDVVGVSVINFNFNRLCDFQYLPLTSKQPETSSSKTENIYEKILPSQLPSSDWLESEASKNMEQFLLPVRFSFYDSSQSKVTVDKSDKIEPKLKLRAIENSSKVNSRQQKSVCRIFRKTRQTSVFVSFKDKEVPTQPLENAMKLVKHRNLEPQVGTVKKLFEERPIWTKAAIRYITGISDEHTKIVLPVVAYHITSGPWRITWVKFGYDPRKDPKARIYQTLDYRIRTADSTKMKVSAKRSYAGKTSLFLGADQTKKVSLKNDMSAKPKTELDERFYVLRPLTIPPARQMFYQFCDLLLPEIQDLISRLPQYFGTFCHPKNGFFPDDFIDKSRKIVNAHVLEAVQKELLEDKKILKEKVSKEKETKASGSSLDYYNQMLSNIKKGIYRNVGVQPQSSQMSKEFQEDIELISLSSDEDNEFTVGDIIQSSIPEKLEGGEEEEHSEVSESSDEAEIDMEAVQEINEMISQLNEKI